MCYLKQFTPVVLAILVALLWSEMSKADSGKVLPYCETANPHTPAPSSSEPFFIARSNNGNFLPQWCNVYNLVKNKAWATNTQEVKLNKNNAYDVVSFRVIDTPGTTTFTLRHFNRCSVSVTSPSSWTLGDCSAMTDKEGLVYVNQFYPEAPYR